MASFKAAFGRALSGDVVAELYTAEKLSLKVMGLNQPGYDALGPNNERYQIKYRSAQTQNVDLNSFDFDYLVLVNLDEDYSLTGMWRISRAQAREIFVERPDLHKYQATQKKVKSIAETLAPNDIRRDKTEPALSESGPRRRWAEARGAAPFPLTGEDAQLWVSQSRQEDDEARGGQQ